MLRSLAMLCGAWGLLISGMAPAETVPTPPPGERLFRVELVSFPGRSAAPGERRQVLAMEGRAVDVPLGGHGESVRVTVSDKGADQVELRLEIRKAGKIVRRPKAKIRMREKAVFEAGGGEPWKLELAAFPGEEAPDGPAPSQTAK